MAFTKELARITKPDGKVVISVPNGDESMLAVRIKNAVGMTKEKYGHIVTGYDTPELSRILKQADLVPGSSSTYSKFFTEMLELVINFGYVMVLARKDRGEVKEGTIAPSSADQLRSVEKQYRLYSAIYPFLVAISSLDKLLFFATGYAVSVVARKPS